MRGKRRKLGMTVERNSARSLSVGALLTLKLLEVLPFRHGRCARASET
jgi:hypothetical protein